MKQEFSVHAEHDQASQVVEVVIRCSPNLVKMALDVALLQIETVVPQEGAIAPALAPRQVAPVVPIRSQVDSWVDAEWKEKNSGPVLPNMRGF